MCNIRELRETNLGILLYSYYKCAVYTYPLVCCFIMGSVILTVGLTQIASATIEGDSEAGKIIKQQLCKILELLEGPFGALIMVVAGLAAVVTAAMGAYKMAMSCVVIACGSYIVGAFLVLFFPDADSECKFENGKRKSTTSIDIQHYDYRIPVNYALNDTHKFKSNIWL